MDYVDPDKSVPLLEELLDSVGNYGFHYFSGALRFNHDPTIDFQLSFYTSTVYLDPRKMFYIRVIVSLGLVWFF